LTIRYLKEASTRCVRRSNRQILLGEELGRIAGEHDGRLVADLDAPVDRAR
jgi:hypothetical protein